MVSIAAPKDGPEYERRLIPTLVDEMAGSTPDHVSLTTSPVPSMMLPFEFEPVQSTKLHFGSNTGVWKGVDFETSAYLSPSKAFMYREEYG